MDHVSFFSTKLGRNKVFILQKILQSTVYTSGNHKNCTEQKMDFSLLEEMLFRFLQIMIPHSLPGLTSIENDFVSFREVVIQHNCHINNFQRRR